MRILVIADSSESRHVIREAIQVAAHDVAAEAAPTEVLPVARRAAPDVAVIEAESDAQARAVLERARGATERELGAVLMLPDSDPRLRLRAHELSVVCIARHAIDELSSALAELRPHVRGEARARDVRLRLDIDRGTVSANGDSVSVTPSEAVLLDELLQEPGAIVRHERLIEAIWGGHHPANVGGALRMHVHTLRAKLAHMAPQAHITNQPHIGYVLNLR